MERREDHATGLVRRRLAGGYQILQALVGIRLRTVADPESRRHLVWLSDLTAALGLMSRRLTADGEIEVVDYLHDLAQFWRRAAGRDDLRIEVRAQPGLAPETLAQSLAIIAHELVGNAARHAFADGRSGAIAIAFTRASDGVSLVVRDTGLGAEGLDEGEGLGLVRGLVDHLRGRLDVETAPEQGVGVRVWLPMPSSSEGERPN
ncbi:ATP-binding protein [Brevundimonas balnearis]|uniref:histidine kinase n=1 Tax=Brevundimonas balnearis TaxID=1572858 RepID=A0ABV6R169_9CAUL